jgi:hypothetical protein
MGRVDTLARCLSNTLYLLLGKLNQWANLKAARSIVVKLDLEFIVFDPSDLGIVGVVTSSLHSMLSIGTF